MNEREAGVAAFHAGRLDEAAAILERVLTAAPGDAVACHLLGLIAAARGDPARALALIDRSVRLRPQAAAFHVNRGGVLAEGGQRDAAIAAWRRALRLDRGQVDAWTNLGHATAAAGRADEAVAAFRAAAALAPTESAPFARLGRLAVDRGDADAADAAIRAALACVPPAAVAAALWRHRAGLAARRGAADQVSAAFDRLLLLDPADPDARRRAARRALAAGDAAAAATLLADTAAVIACGGRPIGPGDLGAAAATAFGLLGEARARQGRDGEAAAALRRAAVLRPGESAPAVRLAARAAETPDAAAAAATVRAAVIAAPGRADARSTDAILALRQDRFAGAIARFRAALALDPGFDAAWHGLVQAARGQAARAIAVTARRGGGLAAATLAAHDRALDAALARAPDDAELHMGRAAAAFLRGDRRTALDAYAWRWRSAAWAAERRPFPQPPWRGERGPGVRLLVWGEQGVGDEVMFFALLPALRGFGVSVIVECTPKLVPLLARSLPWLTVMPRLDPPPALLRDPGAGAATHQIAAGDLMAALGPCATGAYLIVDPARVVALPAGRTIGISWFTRSARGGRERSVALGDLVRSLAAPGVALVNLQYDADPAALARHGVVAVPGVDPFDDLDGLAAVIAAVDEVVTIDNATVHLAGALGQPTRVILPRLADWRWPAGEGASGWWPTVEMRRKRRQAALRP